MVRFLELLLLLNASYHLELCVDSFLFCYFSKSVECLTPLGMESGKITDGQVTASSYYNGDDRYAPKHGRLNKVSGLSGSLGAWAAGQKNIHQWIQVDLGVQNMAVTRVATQGRHNDEEWVISYKLQYSNNMVYFQYYREAEFPLKDKVNITSY